LVVIPDAEFKALANDQEKKQFLGNYLYQFVQRKLQIKKPDTFE